MMLYDDLQQYKSRTVYKHSENANRVGWHSVRILGWGFVENTQGQIVKYWVRNI